MTSMDWIDEIEARANLVVKNHEDWSVSAAVILAGHDVPKLLAEIRRLRAELEAAEVDMCEMASPDASPCDYCGKKTSCAHIVSCPRRGYDEFVWRGLCTENGGQNEQG